MDGQAFLGGTDNLFDCRRSQNQYWKSDHFNLRKEESLFVFKNVFAWFCKVNI